MVYKTRQFQNKRRHLISIVKSGREEGLANSVTLRIRMFVNNLKGQSRDSFELSFKFLRNDVRSLKSTPRIPGQYGVMTCVLDIGELKIDSPSVQDTRESIFNPYNSIKSLQGTSNGTRREMIVGGKKPE